MFYASQNSCQYSLSKGAYIVKFETRGEAEDYILEPFIESLQGEKRVDIQPAQIDGPWLEFPSDPRVDKTDAMSRLLSRFGELKLADCTVQEPRQHPGNLPKFWLFPKPTILIGVPR